MTVWWQDPHPGSVQRNMMSFLPLPDTSSLPPSPLFSKAPEASSLCRAQPAGGREVGRRTWVLGTGSVEALWVRKEAEQGGQGALPPPASPVHWRPAEKELSAPQMGARCQPPRQPRGRRQEPGLWGSIAGPHAPAVWLQPGCFPFLSHSFLMCEVETLIEGGRG